MSRETSQTEIQTENNEGKETEQNIQELLTTSKGITYV